MKLRAPFEALETRRLLSTSAVANAGFAVGEMLADATRNLVYVLDGTSNKVVAVDTQAGRATSFADLVGAPTGLAESPDGTELFVSSHAGNRVQVFSLPDLIPLRDLDVASPGSLASGVGHKLYVTGSDQNAGVRQIDDLTGQLKNSFGSFYDPLLTTNRAGTTLYISELGLSTTGTDVYDISDLIGAPVYKRALATSMANGKDLAVDEQYNRLYSMSGGEYGVYALNIGTNTGSLWSFGDYGGGVAEHPDVSYIWGGGYGGYHRFDRATGAKLEDITTLGGTSFRGMAMTANGNLLFRSSTANKLGIIGRSSLAIASIPNARFSATAEDFPGLNVAFDGTLSKDYESNGTIASWSWDFGDGAKATGSKVSHLFSATGKYTVKLTVTDAQGNADDFTSVINLSNPPSAEPVTVTTPEETPVTVTLSGADPDGDAITFRIGTAPAHGRIRLDGASVLYTPDQDFFGTDTFTYSASDGTRQSAPTLVTINVTNVNDAPVAIDDIVALAPSGPTQVKPLANDIDVDGDTLTITAFTQPALGGTVIRDNDAFFYSPPAGAVAGANSFSYTLSDGTISVTGKVYFSHGAASLDGDWTTYGASAAHTGEFSGTVGAADAVPGWSLPAGSTNGNPVAVGGGRVYTTTGGWSGMTLQALDPATGKVLWTHPFEGGNSLNPVTYWKGRLYLQRGNHSSDTQLWAIDAASGSTIWSTPFSAQWESYFAPAVNDQGIWIDGGYYGGMYGFKHDGSQIAFINQTQYDEWTPSILGNYVYSYVAGSFQKYAMNGSLQWTNTKTWNWSGWSMNRVSALSGNEAFLIGNPDLYAVNLNTGATAWTVPGTFSGSPAVSGSTVFANSGQAVKSYNVLTGAAGTTYTAGSALMQQPIITDDAVIAASSTNTYIFARSTGQLLQTLPKGGAISLADNRLYIVGSDGSMQTYAFAHAAAVAPAAPVASAGGPYTVNEGSVVSLTGDASLAPGATVSAWQWDLDYDGVTFNIDATGKSTNFSAASLDGAGTKAVALRVTDSNGQQSIIASAVVTIQNVAPTAAFTGGGAVTIGAIGSVSFTSPLDPSAADTLAGFTYSYDFDNNGTFEISSVTAASATVPASALSTVGSHTIHGRITDKDGGSTDYTTTITVNPLDPQQPFSGTPIAIADLPVTIQLEDFDKGGEGIAYHDLDSANLGGQYRKTEGVDIQTSTDAGGGFGLGYVKAGEWLEYTINVAAAGNYDFDFRLAATSANGKFHAEVDGVNVTGALTVPNTGGYQTWKNVGKTGVALTAGQHVIRVAMDTNGANGSVGNFNWLKLTPSNVTPPPPPPPPPGDQTPYTGTPIAIGANSVTIQAEDFDKGGEGIAYHDIEKSNQGGKYRTGEGVDIGVTTDTGGGFNIGFVKAGEWLEYTIDVATAGNYTFDFRLAAASSNGKFHVEVDGANATGALTVPNTNGWQTWKTLTKTGVPLSAGQHVLRIAMDTNGSGGSVTNFNSFTIKPDGQQPPPPPPPPPGQSITIQAEDFDAGSEGVAYHDLDSANQGGKYRTTGVDIQATTDTGGGYNIGYVKAGEWLNYTTTVTTAGSYNFDFRLAAGAIGAKFHLEVDGVDVTGAIAVPNTGGWQNWTTITKTGVTLSAGTHVLKLKMDTNGTTGSVANFNWLKLTQN